MKVLVTGATGRFGPYLVEALVNAGHDVVLFARRKVGGPLETLVGDIRDYDACSSALSKGFDAVHHAAAQPGPTDHPELSKQRERPDLPFNTTMESNIMGTYNLLQAAVRFDVKTFVMTGSNCALGHGFRISDRPFPIEYLPVDERHPTDVEDSYSYSKRAGEYLLESYTKAYGIRTYCLRSAGICDRERRENMAATSTPAAEWDPWLAAWVGSEDLARAHVMLMEQAESIEAHEVFFCNSDDTTYLEPSMDVIRRFKPELVQNTRGITGHGSLISNRLLQETVGWVHQTQWRSE